MAKLFIAEDDALMVKMYERAFRLSGHETVTAADGQEALATLERMDPKPSCILLDIMMPVLNGFEVLSKIKEDDRLKDIPVVLLTNLAGPQDEKKGLELGAALYLVKSQYAPNDVVEKIEAIIKASPREA